MVLLKAENLKIEIRGKTILDVKNLEVNDNEVLCVIGPNGAGKTSLLMALSLLIKPVKGRLFYKGKEVGKELDIISFRRRMSLVLQEPLLLDTTVFENVASGLKIRGLKKKEIKERTEKYLDFFKIKELKERNAHTLSSGEAQRVSLARAYATEPDILLLDEPFSSVDTHTKESLIQDFLRLREIVSTGVIFATHDREEVLRLADRLCVLKEGHIVDVGKVEEVMNDPKDEWVASFFGLETILYGNIVGKADGGYLVRVSGKNIEVATKEIVSKNVLLCIRPENVTIFTSEPSHVSSRNLFLGKVVEIYPVGYHYKVRIDCGFPLWAFVTKNSLVNLDLNRGKKVYASFKATSIRVIER
ncbi:MAG: ABC transporter ATP-binding protein [Deltaproteobacteria bacterium]|nr:ABC transporter ATP-binding protein [Deltaproteobacteria bacterium]